MKHTSGFLKLVEDARKNVCEISKEQLEERLSQGAFLIDVREDNEWAAGRIPGAQHLGRGIIERDIETRVPQKEKELILYCGGGYRSALAAESLQKMGYTNVFSLIGGWKEWKTAGGKEEK